MKLNQTEPNEPIKIELNIIKSNKFIWYANQTKSLQQ
jgi:hypothetical protein